MDQAPRSAFLSMVVKPQELTAVMGVINILKILSQSGGPWITGLLADRKLFWVAFVAAGSLKGTYDVLLLMLFAGRVREPKPSEPRRHEDDTSAATSRPEGSGHVEDDETFRGRQSDGRGLSP